ncbi:MAG: hypothetical protein ACI9W2_001900 [Gammaproteobacteria bacterium]|jgi:hypothetical protein
MFLEYDFPIGNIHYDVQYGIPPSIFVKFLSLVNKSMDTYDPILRSVSDKEITESFLAGKRRLGEIFIVTGGLQLAKEYVEEGLDIEPSDPRLLALTSQIEKLNK